MEVVQVQPRDIYLHYIHIPTKQTSIHWSFKTKRHNINFGVYKQHDHEMFSPLDHAADDKHQSLLNNIKTSASAKLFEQGLTEVIPIQPTQCSRSEVEGSFTATDPGNYVLVFDNTFSKTTSKLLTLSVTLSETPVAPVENYMVTGWLLKKRRKKMQGWAKRWFRLSTTGILSYANSPTDTERVLDLPMAMITHQPSSLTFHIDTDDGGYHLKALNADDFTTWASQLKRLRQTHINRVETWRLQRQSGHLTTIVKTKARRDVERGLQASQAVKEKLASLDQWIQQPAELTRLVQLKHDVDLAVKRQDQLWHAVQNTVWQADPFGLNKAFADLSLNIYDEDDEPKRVSMDSALSGDDFYDAQGGPDDEADSHLTEKEKSWLLDYPVHPHRRQQLPSVAVGENSSALSIFRKNVGKDLSTIALPVSMNEPMSILQRACEELEYSQLLDKAAQLETSMDRLMYVTVFAITSYASSQYRTGRKPFNPMMNETYENIRPDKGFRFISEKVCHHPLTIAAHAESENYTYWQCTQVKSKFWGKSMELITEGVYHVQLTGHDDHYTYDKPSTWIRNMIAGEKYLEHAGEMKVMNHTTGEYAIVTFKEGSGGGMFSTPTKRNDIVAQFYTDQEKKPRRRVVGKWSDSLSEEIDLKRGKTLDTLWTAQLPNVNDYESHYGFTRFCVELNEITDVEKNQLPCTDSRYRPDQRLYELGFVEEADAKKKQIEQKQRDRRHDFELKGMPWNARWFTLQGDPYNVPGFASPESEERQSWVFNHQYWETRKSGQWPKDMFELW